MVQNPISGVREYGTGPASTMREGHVFQLVDLGVLQLKESAAEYKKFTPNKAGRIIGIYAVVEEATTDADADGTIQAEVSGTTTTGGAITIADTAAGATAAVAGKVLQGTAITALNTFNDGDHLNIAKTVTNAFANGSVRILMLLELYTNG